MDEPGQYYHVPEVPTHWKFELLGHAEKTLGDDPIFDTLGIDTDISDKQYPDWVCPLGKLPDGEQHVRSWFHISEGVELLAAIRRQPSGIVRASYYFDSATVVRYDAALQERLAGYDYRRHSLFALARDEVIYHEDTPAEDLNIARRVLSDPRFEGTDPFMRSHIAYRSKDVGLVLPELRRCVRHLGAGEYLKAWWQAEIDLVRRPEEELGAGMPELAKMLEQPGMLESLLVDQ